MHEVLNSFKQHPSQKLHKTFINFEKIPKFSNNPKPRSDLNAWNTWGMRGREVIPSD